MMRPVTVLLLSRTKHLYERVSIWMVIQIRHWRLHSDTFLCLMKWQRIPPHCSPEPSSSVGHWATPSQQNQRKQRRLALQPTFLGSPCRRRRLPILSPRGRGYSSDGKYGFRNLTDPYAREGLRCEQGFRRANIIGPDCPQPCQTYPHPPPLACTSRKQRCRLTRPNAYSYTSNFS